MKKVLFISLGCDKNLVDSEYMIGSLASKGYEITDDETQAQVIVINTCSFIHDAQEESVENILEMAKYKDEGSCKALIVTGCLAQMFGQDMLDEVPQIDAVIGTASADRIIEVVERVLNNERVLLVEKPEGEAKTYPDRMVTTGGHFEYLKIAEGCDKHCTYCIIPKLRGSYRSVPMEQLVKEAEKLAADGVRELNIVAQETTVYGVDLYGKKMLHVLLEKLCEIEDIYWIRILYCYPEEIYPELVETIKDQPKICKYLDLPIQHASSRILKKMGRRTTKEDLLNIVGNLRKEIPEIVLRTTLITGFPGETEEDHDELLDFVDEMEFDRLGVFTYSPQDGTPAAEMPDQVDEEIKTERQEQIMVLQQFISKEKNEKRVGQEIEVFVEGFMPEDNIYIGRAAWDAPNIDGYVFFRSYRDLDSGAFVKCVITEASEYDIIGELI